MEFKLASLKISTSNVPKMSCFLSKLFDGEIICKNDSEVYICTEHLCFELEEKNNFKNSYAFSFFYNEDELSVLKQKVEFLKFQDSTLDINLIDLTEKLCLLDFEGNTWNFEN